jgi:Fe-S-cluster containining protein
LSATKTTVRRGRATRPEAGATKKPAQKPASKKRATKKPRELFDCAKCPGFCCSIYEVVAVTDRDLARLAKHHGLGVRAAERKFTRKSGDDRVLRRKKDALLGSTCRFLDPVKRNCTIYEARPTVCRGYPGQSRCVYYEVVQFERNVQEDEDVVPLIQIRFPKK